MASCIYTFVAIGSLGLISLASAVADTSSETASEIAGAKQINTWTAADADAATFKPNIPLSFEMNAGQVDEEVHYLARAQGYQVFLTPSEVVFSLQRPEEHFDETTVPSGTAKRIGEVPPVVERTALRIRFADANPAAEIAGIEESSGSVNYFISNDPEQWHTNIPRYRQVKYVDVWPGIDAVFYGNPSLLEFDFIVHPEADAGQIGLVIEGADQLALEENGDLIIRVHDLNFIQRAPNVYQEVDGAQIPIQAAYRVLQDDQVSISFDDYNSSLALIVDPVIEYATYIGGTADEYAAEVAIDADGNAYLVGHSYSLDYPVGSSGPQAPYDTSNYWGSDIVVTKLDPTGNVIYSTYVGGFGTDIGMYVHVDQNGRAYVSGISVSPNDPPTTSDFPVTENAWDDTYNGGETDAVIFVLSPDGTDLHYSTFLGGSGSDDLRNSAIEADDYGNVRIFVDGTTTSTDFPIVNGFQESHSQGWNPNDGFVAGIDPAGQGLFYSSYFGGDLLEYGHSIDVRNGIIYTAGITVFPTTPGTHWRHNVLTDGRGVMWCGEDNVAGWQDPTGYGNSWVQALTKEFALPAVTNTQLDLSLRYDTEWNYDFVRLQVSTDGGQTFEDILGLSGVSSWWTDPDFAAWYNGILENDFPQLLSISGPDAIGFITVQIDLSNYGGQSVLLRFVFTSDIQWSDEDGLYVSSYGAVQLDSIELTGHGLDDFEIGSDGWVPTALDEPFPVDFRHGPQGGGDVLTLAIDPNLTGADSLLASATIGGRQWDIATEMRVDDSGVPHQLAYTCSDDLPTTSGAFQETAGGGCSAYVAKISPDLSQIDYLSYFRGSYFGWAFGLELDKEGRMWAVANTNSPDMPTTANAIYPSALSPVTTWGPLETRDNFIFALDPKGHGEQDLWFGSYLGGSNWDDVAYLTLGPDENVYVVFGTESTDLPTTNGSTLAGGVDIAAYNIGFYTGVAIDVRPNDDANRVNLSSAGVIPVAILSAPTFDATTVLPESIQLSGASVQLAGRSANYLCSFTDVNHDNLVDMKCNIETDQISLEPGDSVVVLTASTTAGEEIRGTDVLTIVPDVP